MDDQNQPLVDSNQPTLSQPPLPEVKPPTTANPQPAPKLTITDQQAQDLLLLQNVQAHRPASSNFPTKLLIMAVVLILLIVLVSYFLKAVKPTGSSSSSSSSSSASLGLPNQPDATNGSDTTNQINQDVKACSNPLNAATVC